MVSPSLRVVPSVAHVMRSNPGKPGVSKKALLKRLNHQRKKRQNYRLLPFPIIYFIIYCSSLLEHYHVPSAYLVETGLLDTLVTDGVDVVNEGTTIKFRNVDSHKDFFDWLQFTLLPSVFVTSDYKDAEVQEEFLGRIASYNKIIGGVKLTQQRTERIECQNSKFREFYPYCHPTEGAENDDQDTIVLDARASSRSSDLIEQAKGDGWLSLATYSITVTVVAYNGELLHFAVVELTFKFHRGGSISKESSVVSFPALTYTNDLSQIFDACLIVGLVILAMNEFQNFLRDLKKGRAKAYFCDLWNITDIITILTLSATYAMWQVIATSINNVDIDTVRQKLDFDTDENSKRALDSVMVDLASIGHKTKLCRVLAMFSVLLLGLRVLKYFRFQPKLAILTRTLAIAMSDFFHFFILFMCIFMSYVISGYVLFGSQIREFKSIGMSILTCFKILMGDFNFESMAQVNETAAVLYFCSYQILVFLIMLNLALAIVLDAYAEVKESSQSDASIWTEIADLVGESASGCFDQILCKRKKKHSKESKIFNERLRKALKSGALKEAVTVNADDLQHALQLDKHTAQAIINTLADSTPESSVDESEANTIADVDKSLKTSVEKKLKTGDNVDQKIQNAIESLEQRLESKLDKILDQLY